MQKLGTICFTSVEAIFEFKYLMTNCKRSSESNSDDKATTKLSACRLISNSLVIRALMIVEGEALLRIVDAAMTSDVVH